METQMLVDENKFKIRDKFLHSIQDINHLEILVDDIIDIAGKISREQIVQRFRHHFNMDECARLFAVTLNGDEAIKVSFEDKLVDHCVETHAFAITVNISATHDVRVDLANEPAY